MSTYLPDNDSSNQRDPAQMLYLREPPHNSYPASESPVLAGNMMMYMNFSSSGTLPVSNSDASHQEFVVGIEPRIGESEFGAREMMLMNPMGVQAQGLSLSLSPNIPFQSVQYRNPSHNLGFSSFLSSNVSVSGDDNSSQSKSFLGDASPYAIPNVSRTISDSKYLKAAQELLDEVVNVREALKQHISKNESMKDGKGGGVDGDSPSAQESMVNSAQELSAAEKQDLQSKMSKLLSMLDEVDKRYKQYYHQMQIVVSSFDVIAGCGSAKPYTALALQTISRHFRCLRDAINGQIKVTQKSLGEPDGSANGKGVGISRLRYVDQQLRQQKALQQLGMMQQHTWRPQRGLPESSVSILRAWLFEHFLHPYPKDSDKIMLARQTGLTRSQVSNWFINARVRLWKPMVEEMYKEEAGDAEMDHSNSSSEIAPRSRKGDKKSNGDRDEDIQQSAASTATNHQCSSPRFLESKPNQAHDIEMAGTTSADSDFQNVAQLDERFMAAYQMTDFQNVSLTLGLQHCEDGGLPVPHHGFVNMRGDDMYNAGTSSVGTENVDFDCTEPGNRQQRFGSSHLLHDFVA